MHELLNSIWLAATPSCILHEACVLLALAHIARPPVFSAPVAHTVVHGADTSMLSLMVAQLPQGMLDDA